MHVGLLVREILDGGEHHVDLFVVQTVAQFLKAGAHGVAAGMLADDEVRGLAADGLGRHDFVGFAVLQHAVLMDAGLMRKGVAADDGLVGGDGAADDERQQAARPDRAARSGCRSPRRTRRGGPSSP